MLPPKLAQSQVFNNSQIQVVSSFSLTCFPPTLRLPFHSGVSLSQWGRGMGPALIRRQDILNDFAFPDVFQIVFSLQTHPNNPWCPAAPLVVHLAEWAERLFSYAQQSEGRNYQRRG